MGGLGGLLIIAVHWGEVTWRLHGSVMCTGNPPVQATPSAQLLSCRVEQLVVSDLLWLAGFSFVTQNANEAQCFNRIHGRRL